MSLNFIEPLENARIEVNAYSGCKNPVEQGFDGFPVVLGGVATLIVGPNAVGKTALLHAIKQELGGYYTDTLSLPCHIEDAFTAKYIEAAYSLMELGCPIADSARNIPTGVATVAAILYHLDVGHSYLYLDNIGQGIHHKVFYPLWEEVFSRAKKKGMKVVATTHDWDCIKGFHFAWEKNLEKDGSFFRIGRSVRTANFGLVYPTFYPRESLGYTIDCDVECR